jgi:hypothetical protein
MEIADKLNERGSAPSGTDSLTKRILDAFFVVFAGLTISFQVCLITRVPAWYFYPVAGLVLTMSVILLVRYWMNGNLNLKIESGERAGLITAGIVALLSFFYFRVSFDDMWYFQSAVFQLSHLDQPFYRVPMAFKDERLSESLVSALPAYKVIPALLAKALGIEPVYFYRQVMAAALLFHFPLIYFEWFRRLGFKGLIPLAGFLGVFDFLHPLFEQFMKRSAILVDFFEPS